MRSPARTKYRKQQKGRNRGAATRATELSYGDYGLQALGHAWLSARVIEAARVAMTRRIKRSGQIWVRPFPDKPITSKPAETRMGKGKGAPEGWVAVVKPGQVLYEMECADEATAVGALALAASKLPGGLPLRVLRRQDQI